MDDADGLPLSSPLPLSPPAVQALIDNQDALPSSESTGGDDDVDMEESDKSKCARELARRDSCCTSPPRP